MKNFNVVMADSQVVKSTYSSYIYKILSSHHGKENSKEEAKTLYRVLKLK